MVRPPSNDDRNVDFSLLSSDGDSDDASHRVTLDARARRSPNAKRLAAVTTDRVVQMFDDSGAKRDKFSTKPAQSDGPKNFVVRGMAFSPCSTKLAVGQSDNIVFVYKLGAEWGDKKSICNKFLQHHPVTALAWPAGRAGELAFATADGKVRVGTLKTNKAATLYAHPEQSYVVALCASPDGTGVCSGHLDGSVFVFSFTSGIATKLVAHPCAPYGLAWGAAPAEPARAAPRAGDRGGVIACAGADKRLTFYDARGEGGRAKQTFDHGADDPDAREFSCAAFAADGETLAVGSFDAFHVYAADPRRGSRWVLKTKKHVPNLYTVSALAWRADGARLAVGALRGNVDVYDACARRRRLVTRAKAGGGVGETYDVAFTSRAAFVATRASDGAKVVLRAKSGFEILEDSVTVKRDRYVVARTKATILLADLETGLASEAPELGDGVVSETESSSSRKNARFSALDFDADERSCVVRDAGSGELAVVEYGVDGYVGTARASSVAPELVSLAVRGGNARGDRGGGDKKLAYLVDARTIRVDRLLGDDAYDDASRSVSPTTPPRGVAVTHASRVDWLELNARGTHLLFRDKKRRLFLTDVAGTSATTDAPRALLEHVTYAQWVPGADAIVAQANSRTLCVWYSLDAPEKVSHVSVRGDVASVERADGVTTVTLAADGDDDANPEKTVTSVVTLDESLVAFDALLKEGALAAAADALEPSLKLHGGVSSETEPMWAELSRVAVSREDAATARRCAAALGAVARADFLDDGPFAEIRDGTADGLFGGAFGVEDKENDDEKAAEKGSANNESAESAALSTSARLAMLERRFGDAESLLASRGRVAAAVAMWRCLGRLDHAAEAARRAGRDEHAEQLAREHLEWLKSTGQEEAAGALLQKRGDAAGAIRLFLKGGVPARAASLAIADAKKTLTPGGVSADARVVEEICAALKRASLHSKAGELFHALGRVDEALESYAAGDAFAEACALVRAHPGKARGVFSTSALEQRWGDHLMRKGGASNAKEAAHHYVEAGDVVSAVSAALEAGEAETALEILDADEARANDDANGSEKKALRRKQFLLLAKHHERAGSFAPAEACFLRAGAPLEAVEMFVKHDRWDAARRVAEKSGDARAVAELYARRGAVLESRRAFSDAETAYAAANRHDLAIAMYEKHRLFDQQLKLIGQRHGAEAAKAARSRLAVALAEEGNRKEAERRFAENGDWKLAVKMYRDAGAWEEAVRAARAGGGGAASKQVAYAWARSLDEPAGAALLKKFGLLDAGVEHACGGGDFEHALSLAKHGGYKAAQMKEVYLKRALFLEDEGKFAEAEAAFIEADKPKEAIEMYSHAEDWTAACRVAETAAPELVSETLCAAADAALKKSAASASDGSGSGPDSSSSRLAALTDAERLFIKAKRPDLAIGAYRERDMWDDAIRVASNYAPRRKLELENERSRAKHTRGSLSEKAPSADDARARKVDALLEKASRLERSGDYAGAVDAYLEVDRRVFGASPSADEKTKMTRAWRAAVKLAGERVPGKTRGVVSETAYRIRKLGDAAAADDLLAVHGISPAEARERYVPGAGAGASGAVISGETAAAAGDDGASAAASSEADALRRAAHAARSGDGATGASALAALPKGPPVDAEQFATYETVAAAALAFALEEGDARIDEKTRAMADVEAYLARLVDSMRATPDVLADALRTFRDLREAALLTRVSLTAARPKRASSPGAKSVAAKAATSALRFASRLPADAAFFRAGALWRAAGDANSAFVFLNRYLDIADAVDDAADASFDAASPSPRRSSPTSGSAGKSLRALDNDDFVSTDVPPPERLGLPAAHAVDEKTREEARDWVLTVSMDRAVTQQLPKRACQKCGAAVFAGAAKCHGCGAESEKCAVTGWPVPPGERVDAGGGRGACRADWNAWADAVGTDPWDPAREAAMKY